MLLWQLRCSALEKILSKPRCCVILHITACLDVCARGRQRGKTKRAGRVCVCVRESEFEALLRAYIAAQITNLGAVIPASRCYFKPTFEANHPVMILLIANEGSDGR